MAKKIAYKIGAEDFTGVLWGMDADTFDESNRLLVGYDYAGGAETSNVIQIWRVANQARIVVPPVVTPTEPPVDQPSQPTDPPAADDEVTTVAEMVAAAKGGAGKTYLVNGVLNNVNLQGVKPKATVVFVGQPGTRVQSIFFQDSANLYFRQLRLGGESDMNRIAPRALFDVADSCKNLVLDGCELAYTLAYNNGNQGYAVRAVNGNLPIIDGLTVVRCHIHHIAADGFQIAGVKGFVVDRNELAYICQESTSTEHSDSLQIMSLAGPGVITNNYIHHVGYFNEQHNPPDGYGAGQLLVHGWNNYPVQFENNLIRECRNYHPMFKDESTGAVADGWSFVRNTIWRCGPPQPTANRTGFWRGEHAFEGNVFQSAEGSGVPKSEVITGAVFDSDWNCTSHPDRGYRKPAGVHW